ncbi:hypothetical protein ACFSTE_20840 [Aquimarina hainanensis]|uniref:STAS/SEC14 domain-containing protein n=1 Tax=Aquimarina hainanensis TaxID=1578017 RepID=A0ABW5NCK6_9FLAO|nr:hypothetical protein [Aquimarina sp. TRL1]QKX07195.1 hypothetical protein HN014_20505 [Aquimarina sp. TRL1]
MITSYNFDFCAAEIHSDYIKTIINEGATIVPEHNKILKQVVDLHFQDKPFVYITHRVNSYSVNPTVYIETSKIPNLIAFAVVSDNPMQETLTQLEKPFFKKEFALFRTMEDALIWKDKMIESSTVQS